MVKVRVWDLAVFRLLTKSNALMHSEHSFSHSKASKIIEYFVSLEYSPHLLVSARILFRIILFYTFFSRSVYFILICVYDKHNKDNILQSHDPM